jgi:hypothetical protein
MMLLLVTHLVHQRRQNVARTALLKMADVERDLVANLVAVTRVKPFAGKVALSPAMRPQRD